MKITIIYATNSGGTMYASQIVQEVFKQKGYEVALKEVQTATLTDIEMSDLTILASCSWGDNNSQGQLPEQFDGFLNLVDGKTFPQKRFAIFALGDSSYTYFAGAADHLEDLVGNMQGLQLGETLRIDGFYFKEEENTKLLEIWANSIVEKNINV